MPQLRQYNLGDEIPPSGDLDSVLHFLSVRRSSLALNLESPGPTRQQLEQILTIAARVPDHRRLSPFRFIVIEGERRISVGNICADLAARANPELPEALIAQEQARFMRAPLVVAVVYSPKDDGKTPEWEQTLACGACCYNMLLAAKASGFGAQWITEWLAYDRDVAATLGLLDHEHIAGFIYIGSNNESLKERARPELSDLTTYF